MARARPPRQSRLALCRDPYDDADQPARYRQLCAFEPGFYAEKGELFAPYSYLTEEGEVKDRNLGYAAYNYHAKEWYAPPNASTATIGANPILTRVGETV